MDARPLPVMTFLDTLSCTFSFLPRGQGPDALGETSGLKIALSVLVFPLGGCR